MKSHSRVIFVVAWCAKTCLLFFIGYIVNKTDEVWQQRHRLWERDEIWQIDRRGLAAQQHRNWLVGGAGSPSSTMSPGPWRTSVSSSELPVLGPKFWLVPTVTWPVCHAPHRPRPLLTPRPTWDAPTNYATPTARVTPNTKATRTVRATPTLGLWLGVSCDDVIDDVIMINDGTYDDIRIRYTLHRDVMFSYDDWRRTLNRRRPTVYCVRTLAGIWFLSAAATARTSTVVLTSSI